MLGAEVGRDIYDDRRDKVAQETNTTGVEEVGDMMFQLHVSDTKCMAVQRRERLHSPTFQTL